MATGENQSKAAIGVECLADEQDRLLRQLADLAILPPGRITEKERGIVDDVVACAVSRIDPPMRRQLAERIGQLPEGPRNLTLALARDTIDIAAPILRNCPGLQASDLAQIVRDVGAEHHLVISERRLMPAAVVDALVEYGNPDAICRMLANRAAEISTRSMEALVRRSASEPAFQPLVLTRPELTIRLAQLMFWWVSPEARREILSRFSVERRLLHDNIREVLGPALAASETDEAFCAILSTVRPPVTLSKARFAQLLDLAAMGQREGFVAEIALAGRIRPETAFRIINDVGGEPLAVLAKAVGLMRRELGDLIVGIAELRANNLLVRADLERITAIFDTISIDRADFALHCWDWAISAEAQVRAPVEG